MRIDGKRTHEEFLGTLCVLNFRFFRQVLLDPSIDHAYASSLWVKVVPRRRVVPEGEPTQRFRCQFQFFFGRRFFLPHFVTSSLLERFQIYNKIVPFLDASRGTRFGTWKRLASMPST